MTKHFLLLAIVVFVGCTKPTSEESETGLPGKWQHSEVYISPGGGGGLWRPANDPEPVYLEFGEEGSVRSNHAFYSQFSRYEMHGDTAVMKALVNGYRQEARATIKDGKLNVSYLCICGCGDRFVRGVKVAAIK